MKKIFLLTIVFNLSYLIKSQRIFNEPYYFVGPDEMYVYKQSNDTLYTSTTFSLQSFNLKKYKSHYKILNIAEKPSSFIVMKVESIDSIPLTTVPYPEDRFKIFIYKKNNEKELLLIRNVNDLTKEKMTNYNTDTIQSKNNFGMNLYSLSYMKELLKLKRIKIKKDVDEINNELNHPKYLIITENFIKHNRILDPYASILTATLINTACLHLGYSPIGASFSMSILNSDREQKEKEKIIKEFYKHIDSK